MPSIKKRGNEFLAQGRLEEAAECYSQAVSINPDYAEGYLNLGFVLNGQKLYEKAAGCLRQALVLNPKLEDAYYILGMIAQEQGDQERAIENFSRALELKPDFEIIYRDLCQVLFESGQHERAKQIINQGLSLNPEFADFHHYLGNLHYYDKELEKAIACYQKALSIQPDYAAVCSNMGKAYIDLGKIDEAMSWYRKAFSLDSDAIAVESISALLFAQSYKADYSPTQYIAEARYYGSKVMEQIKPYTRWAVAPTGQAMLPLRVGLVSGDFNAHPVGFFLESVLEHLDSAKIELVAYPTRHLEDALTARIKPRFAVWQPIVELSDEAAAQKIHEDAIHILIDLAGHTSHNRLPVFAWRPAPVQLSWLGYFASTGVPGMDYLLADLISVPESHRPHFTETVWYLPDTRLCFTPPSFSDTLPLKPPPAVRNRYITFGCFQNVSKLNDAVLALWGQILNAMPQARLRIQNAQMHYPQAREHLQQRLAHVGIAPQRVTIEGPLPRGEYLAAHAEVDIILDTFPYPGGTTTCEALWMGVPTVTLAGDTLLARQGASLLSCAGLEDWIANDQEDYVARALAHAAEVNRLVQLRSGLRQQVLASPSVRRATFCQAFGRCVTRYLAPFPSIKFLRKPCLTGSKKFYLLLKSREPLC